jgi:fumarate hydratase class I
MLKSKNYDAGKPMPDYFKTIQFIMLVLLPSGSFGPTTAGRMDVYVEEFQNMGKDYACERKQN